VPIKARSGSSESAAQLVETGTTDKSSPPGTASLQSLFCFSVSFLFNLSLGWSQRCRCWRRRLCCRRGHGHNLARLKPSCLRFQGMGVFRRNAWRRQLLVHVTLAFSILLFFRLSLTGSESRKHDKHPQNPQFLHKQRSNVRKAPVITAVGKFDHVPKDRSNRGSKAPASNDAGAMDRYFNCITAL
jgi:hypothetical protein